MIPFVIILNDPKGHFKHFHKYLMVQLTNLNKIMHFFLMYYQFVRGNIVSESVDKKINRERMRII